MSNEKMHEVPAPRQRSRASSMFRATKIAAMRKRTRFLFSQLDESNAKRTRLMSLCSRLEAQNEQMLWHLKNICNAASGLTKPEPPPSVDLGQKLEALRPIPSPFGAAELRIVDGPTSVRSSDGVLLVLMNAASFAAGNIDDAAGALLRIGIDPTTVVFLTVDIQSVREGLFPSPPRRRGSVYFLRDGDAVKVGVSKDPKKRVASIASARPAPTQWVTDAPGEVWDEQRMHRALRAHRIRGEWFNACPVTEAAIQHVETKKRLPTDEEVAVMERNHPCACVRQMRAG
jgi:hypothetical protein